MGLTSTCGTWAFELPLKQSIAVTTVTKSRKINFRRYRFVTLRQPRENMSSYNKSIRDRHAKKCAILAKSGADDCASDINQRRTIAFRESKPLRQLANSPPSLFFSRVDSLKAIR